MIWGYHYFRKHPYIKFAVCKLSVAFQIPSQKVFWMAQTAFWWGFPTNHDFHKITQRPHSLQIVGLHGTGLGLCQGTFRDGCSSTSLFSKVVVGGGCLFTWKGELPGFHQGPLSHRIHGTGIITHLHEWLIFMVTVGKYTIRSLWV